MKIVTSGLLFRHAACTQSETGPGEIRYRRLYARSHTLRCHSLGHVAMILTERPEPAHINPTADLRSVLSPILCRHLTMSRIALTQGFPDGTPEFLSGLLAIRT